jgi:hypothetical protein
MYLIVIVITYIRYTISIGLFGCDSTGDADKYFWLNQIQIFTTNMFSDPKF